MFIANIFFEGYAVVSIYVLVSLYFTILLCLKLRIYFYQVLLTFDHGLIDGTIFTKDVLSSKNLKKLFNYISTLLTFR